MKKLAAVTALAIGLAWPVQATHETALAKNLEPAPKTQFAAIQVEPVPEPTKLNYPSRVIALKPQLTISRGEESRKGYEMTIEATAYTHTGHQTFTETWPKAGTIAVDPKVIPLKSEIWVEGYGWGVAEDTGGLIKGNIIDLFMETKQEAVIWGRQQVRIIVIPPDKPYKRK
ncbi:MAG: 3D domain-containing protein [Desulfitobacteriaceae bacterium]|nr:3D domain-containing protein [Desulfitobacteriaceae bacterium]